MGAAVALPLLLAACGNGDGDGGVDPPATDDEAFAVIQEVIDEIDAAWARLVVDPSVVDEPGRGDMKRYEELHTPDGPALTSGVEWLEGLADQGRAHRAPPGRPYQQTLMMAPEADGADTVEFELCRLLETEVVAAGDQVLVPYEGAVVLVGEGEARRVNGLWRLHRLKGQQSMVLGRDDGEPFRWFSTTLDTECDLEAFDLPGS